MKLYRNTTSYTARRRSRRGFTLVELIVVLMIIAILAAIGVSSIVGYIKKSRFDKNEQYAITIYQTAQNIVSQKVSNGTIEDWIIDIPGIELPSLSTENTQTDASAHCTVALTYNPKSSGNDEDKYIYEFLAPYFYDTSVFNGTLAVEFDISAINDNGVIVYSASVKSAFFSIENSVSSGWDPEYCVEDGTATVDGLPVRTASFRFLTSHVGYFDGTEASAKPMNITPVYLPQSTTYELDGHIVAGSDAQGYLFNFRNGETLDVSWAIFDNDGTAHDVHNENIIISLFDADNNDQLATISLDWSETPAVNYQSLKSLYGETTTYEYINNRDQIVRTSVEGTVSASVNGQELRFPITISKVVHDGRIGCPDPNIGYYEYTLSLDCMMERSYDTDNSRYSFIRTFGTGNAPRNIYATISGSATTYSLNDVGQSTGSTLPIGGTTNEPVYAARAINDPVYLDRVENREGHITYVYTVRDHAAEFDGADSKNEEKTITGKCVVNTLFGDLRYSRSVVTSSGGATDTISGSVWGSATDSIRDVVITSYRHLYNIRNIGNATATFRIVRNLNWYYHIGNNYASEVKVFQPYSQGQAYRFRSPAVGGNLMTVSFPALGELKSGQTLMSMSVAGGTTYSINNVQLRWKSFTSSDGQYGLICKNSGIICNIYTNNLNLIMTDYSGEGIGNDYSSISSSNDVTITTSGATAPGNNKPVGGLIGYNVGLVGSSDSNLDESTNTIEMRNTIVMAGGYWICGEYNDGVGGVIGKNEGRNNKSESVYGVIRLTGNFAVLGGNHVGGIIGRDRANVGARLVVDGRPSSSSEFIFPVITNNNNARPSCIIAARYYAGGAVGTVEGSYSFSYGVSDVTVTGPADNGALTFRQLGDSDYQIDVILPGNSLILGINNNSNGHVGGAIGYFLNGKDDCLSIRVRNSGNIIGQGNKARNYGGAIGYYQVNSDTYVRNVYLDVVNYVSSNIGSFSKTSSATLRAGGAVGLFESNKLLEDYSLTINIENNGLIVAYGGDPGSGGAIGAMNNSFKGKLIISAVNQSTSNIVGLYSGSGGYRGSGGAIGGISDGNNMQISENSVIYAENRGNINGYDNVGGATGSAVSNFGKIYAVNYGKITGRNYTGGAVGRHYRNQYGSIQSIMVGATISGGNYVGGAVGNVVNQYGTILSILSDGTIYGLKGTSGQTGTYVGGAAGKIENFYDGSSVKTVVEGNSSVSGEGAYVGGVIGDCIVADTGTTGVIELSGDSTVPVFTVTSTGSQVGGVIGRLYSAVVNSVIVKTPDQSPANGLIMKVSGVNDVGGAIGYLQGKEDINVNVSVVLHPHSYVKGSGCDVGGAIGKIDRDSNNRKYSGSITVRSIMGTASEGTSVIQGSYYVGGAVGYWGWPYTYRDENSSDAIKVDFSLSPWTVKATGKTGNDSCVGGAIGYFANAVGDSSTAIPVTVILGSSNVIGAGNNVGGAIGQNKAKGGTLYVSSTAGSKITGADNVGGVIGSNESSVLSVTTQIVGDITGSVYVGGAIGKNTASALVEGVINSTITGNITGSGNYVGGAIGYNKSIISYAITVNLIGKVSGVSDVGGVIGYNDSVDIALADSTATVISATINGSITGTGDNVGGGLGHIKNNTVTGVVSVTFQSSSTGTENNVTGNNNVGGIIGFNEGTTFSSGISSSIPAGCKVEGKGYVGGAIGNNQGILTSVQSTVDGVISGTAVTGCVSGAIGYNTRSISSVTSTINSNGKVQASGDNVGGAIGLNEAAVSTISVTSSGSITGEGRIGGAVGYNKGALEYITATINGAVTGAGTSGDVGGAIGYNEASINGRQDSTGNVVAIAVVLNGSVTSLNSDGSARYDNVGGGIGHTKNNTISGNITVTLGSTARVEGNNNIGGLIGFNEGTSMSKTLTCMIPVNCMVRGYGSNGRVGGVIGYNNGSIVDVVSVINGSVISVNGGYVGGAIGYHYNAKITGTIDVTISGTVSSATEDSSGATTVSYDYVGGAIGYCEDNNKAPTNTVNILKVKLEGNAVVEGKNYVGGVLGFTSCNIESVSSEVTGSSQIIGVNCVGGAIGLARAYVGQTGNSVFDGTATGKISNVSVTISADYALTGITCIGGAIGQTGDKIDGSRYYSAVMMNVNCEINSRYLFDPVATGTDVGDMACAGGVIGRIGEGRVESITLSGTGGACNIDSDIFGSEYPYNGPVVSYPNTVLVAARGQSVGGIIGQVGMSEAINQANSQNVTISKIIIDGSINLCVISVNGADRIGGWIGCGLGSSGGFGNRSEDDYNDTSKRAVFDVDNVRLVYSRGSCVGGFCGFSRSYDNNIPATFADVIVSLNDANIIGSSGVGGAIGYAQRSYFKKGQITVYLYGRTNIGDITGNAMPGDTNVYPSICYEAGGAIGRFNTTKNNFNVPIRVYFEGSLCRIWAGGGSSSQNSYGVGGVFGSIINASNAFNASARIIVEPLPTSSAGQLLVYSRYSNAGGAIGYVNKALLNNYTSSSTSYAANVRVECSNNSGSAGGFVGRVSNNADNKFKYCYCIGTTVVATGSSASAGGFVGYMDNGTISYCYTTSTVSNISGSYTGGFGGRVVSGTIEKCYVGGHTYGGAYLDSEGNISGYQNVGGFVGAVSGSATISDSYTTASVRGTGNNIGGFVGQSSGSCTIKNNYCTGLVIGNGSYVGAFAGYAYDVGKFTGTNRALYPVNTNRSLIGSSNDSGVIVWANSYSDINTSGTRYTAVPFDASLAGASFPFTAVIDSTHHGDWPIITNTGTRNLSLADIEFIDVEFDEQGRPVFEFDPAGLDLANHIRVTYPGVTDPLVYDEDYVLVYDRTSGVGEASVVVVANPSKADNDYYGAKTANYIVTEASLATDAVVVSIEPGYDEEGNPLYFGYDAAGNLVPMSEDEGGYPAYVYTGAAIDPTVTVTYRVGDVEYTLTPNSDFYLSYDRSNIDISSDGYITVTVTGYGNYKDNAITTLRFVIIGIDIADADVTLTGATAEDLVYDGNPKTPGVILRIGGQTRREGVDYTVEYRDNVNQGTASVVITGIGILRGTYIAPYEITTADNRWDVAPSIEGWVWDGTDVQITTKCTEGVPHFGSAGDVNYEVYRDAGCTMRVAGDIISDAGDYYLKVYVEDGIVITPDDVEHLNYRRIERILPFTVEPFNISVSEDVEVLITPDSYCVNGGLPVVPDTITVTAVVGGVERELVEGEDYNVNCINNTNVGEAIAVITGINNYAGVRRATYMIRNPIVSFHYQYGNPETIEEVSVLYNKPVERIIITRDGYTFRGWFTDPECAEGQEYDFRSNVVTDIDLYAKWVKQYTVTFVTDTIPGATDIPSLNPITVDEGTLIEDPGEVEYVGYHIVGWYTAPDFSEASRVVYPFELDHDYRLYAKWELNTYTVTFDWQHAGAITTDTVNHGDAVSKPDDEDAPEYEGHGVYGWYIDPQCTTEYNFDTPVTSGITIYARWKSLWTVTFNTQGGSLFDPVTVFDGETIEEPDDPERTGYTFIGWYVDPECTNPFDFSSTIGKNYELYAKWEINKYSVTFISNGGLPVAPQTVEYNSTVSEPQEPTLEGYTFVGWYTDEGLTEEYNFATPVDDDVTLYAKWVHRITFVLRGGGPNIDPIDVPHGGTAAAPLYPSREGYRFTGWYEDPSCTNLFSFDVTIETNYTLYAGWEEE